MKTIKLALFVAFAFGSLTFVEAQENAKKIKAAKVDAKVKVLDANVPDKIQKPDNEITVKVLDKGGTVQKTPAPQPRPKPKPKFGTGNLSTIENDKPVPKPDPKPTPKIETGTVFTNGKPDPKPEPKPTPKLEALELRNNGVSIDGVESMQNGGEKLPGKIGPKKLDRAVQIQ